jgi:hypothetical protein
MSQASSYPSETARSFLRSKTRMGWELTHITRTQPTLLIVKLVWQGAVLGRTSDLVGVNADNNRYRP